MPSTKGIIAQHQKPKLRDQVDARALWLWGWLLDFERRWSAFSSQAVPAVRSLVSARQRLSNQAQAQKATEFRIYLSQSVRGLRVVEGECSRKFPQPPLNLAIGPGGHVRAFTHWSPQLPAPPRLDLAPARS